MNRVGSFDTEQQFRHDHRTQHDVGLRLSLYPGNKLWLILPQPTNAGVGVEQICHDSGSRASRGNCGGRSNVGSVMLPAIDRTNASHSARVIGLRAASITTRTGRFAFSMPMGTSRCKVPSGPTTDSTTM